MAKSEFYEHRKSIPTISKAVYYFKEYGVDPWYAQTILLIESPGKHLSKSYVGAAGPFQIMRTVALKYGLKVNKYVDERSDLKRAAFWCVSPSRYHLHS
ncbi:MAG: transglycosylase SLT domain-containing protein [Bacteroidetes bacterium]|nr:transglycosylase SLT domain-containing protein [Bacteroidota bacterium]